MKTIAYIVTILCAIGLICVAEAAIDNGSGVTQKPASVAGTMPEDAVIIMNPVETGFNRFVDIPIEGREVVFRKEPDFDSKEILRGIIPLGIKRKTYICFAWDVEHSRLYLDSNRNLDLTDDGSVYSGAPNGRKGQQFRNVKLSLPSDSGDILYNVTIRFNGRKKDITCSVQIHSGWEGFITMGGQEWVLALWDNMDGTFDNMDQIILAPATKLKSAELNRYMDMKRYVMPKTVYFMERDYSLRFSFSNGSKNEAMLTAMLDKLETRKGERRFDGSVKSMTLSGAGSDGSSPVMSDNTGESASNPDMTYDNQMNTSGAENIDAFKSEVLVISPDAPVTFKPRKQKNLVTVTRRGGLLELTYDIKAAKNNNSLHNSIKSNFCAPQFAIYQGDRKIAGGSFGYG